MHGEESEDRGGQTVRHRGQGPRRVHEVMSGASAAAHARPPPTGAMSRRRAEPRPRDAPDCPKNYGAAPVLFGPAPRHRTASRGLANNSAAARWAELAPPVLRRATRPCADAPISAVGEAGTSRPAHISGAPGALPTPRFSFRRVCL